MCTRKILIRNSLDKHQNGRVVKQQRKGLSETCRPNAGIQQCEEVKELVPGPRKDLKPMERMKRETSRNSKEVPGGAFCLRWDSLHERSSSHLRKHGDSDFW